MAPRKKAEEAKTKPSPKPATRSSTRLTRSSAKRLNARLTELPTESGKKRKQGKAEESKKKEKKVKAATDTATSTEAQVELNQEEEEEGEEEEEEDEADEDEDEDEDEVKKEDVKEEGDGANKTIVIEHCKQCNAFKTRAMQVKDGLLSAFPGISVLLNPEKPRRGCFEIREESGETFISLLNMKRPFPPLKALDMDQVISDIIDRVKSSTNASE